MPTNNVSLYLGLLSQFLLEQALAGGALPSAQEEAFTLQMDTAWSVLSEAERGDVDARLIAEDAGGVAPPDLDLLDQLLERGTAAPPRIAA